MSLDKGVSRLKGWLARNRNKLSVASRNEDIQQDANVVFPALVPGPSEEGANHDTDYSHQYLPDNLRCTLKKLSKGVSQYRQTTVYERKEVNSSGSGQVECLPIDRPDQSMYSSTGCQSLLKQHNQEPPENITVSEHSALYKIIREGLIEHMSIEYDAASCLYSIKTSEVQNLRPEILKGLFRMCVYDKGVYDITLPLLTANPPQNVIIQVHSGIGKTAAIALAMLSRIDPNMNYPQVICLSASHELAVQTSEVTRKMTKFCPEIKIRHPVRGEKDPMFREVTEHIVIGTPNKMMDWGFKFGAFDFEKIAVVVLDELDMMLVIPANRLNIYRIISELTLGTCQKMVFSATYDEGLLKFTTKIITSHVTLYLTRERQILSNIKQYYVECWNQDQKYHAIANIYGIITVGQILIFCNTRKTVAWLSEKMIEDGQAVALLSGDLTVDERIDVFNGFRDGKQKILIATNSVLSRGIDVQQVKIIVNFDIPVDHKGEADHETYFHWSSQVGRSRKPGLVINLVSSPRTMTVLQQIEEYFDRKIMPLENKDVEAIKKCIQD